MPDRPHILLVQLYSNGDCLFATAVARQIKTDHPDCHLTWAVAKNCQAILQGNPYIDAIRIVDEVPRDNVAAFRRFRAKLLQEKTAGQWQDVIITHNMDRNLALYDGTIRGMLLRAYGKPITVPVQPVLQLSAEELEKVKAFASRYRLHAFKFVVLWEYAPQSGQLTFDPAWVDHVARELTKDPDTCVILSSARKFASTPQIIDASELTIRENAALTHHCHLLIGCSSGITWLNSSSAGKQIPAIQLIDPQARFLNAPSEDLRRYGTGNNGLLELYRWTDEVLVQRVQEIKSKGIQAVAAAHQEALPLYFNTTPVIMYNLLCYGQFGAVLQHIRIMIGQYGWHPVLMRQISWGFIRFPFRLVYQLLRRKK